jgi:release factor glutamine methyltransferase
MTIAHALARARQLGLDRLDAQLLLGHLLGRDRAWLLAHDDEALSAEQSLQHTQLCERRAAGEPLAYLVGEREFHGLQLQVSPAVLIPRPDTETLVDWALELLHGPFGAVQAPEVLDLGTGSGAIALAVKAACPRARMRALDVSDAALQVARGNADRLGLEVGFRSGHWWDSVAAPLLHLALSNPPYIAGGDPHLDALRHEPLQALTPGGDGLGAIDTIVGGAPHHLAPGGWLLIEHGHDQGDAVRQRLVGAGFADVQTRRDIEQRERCSGGRCPAGLF